MNTEIDIIIHENLCQKLWLISSQWLLTSWTEMNRQCSQRHGINCHLAHTERDNDETWLSSLRKWSVRTGIEIPAAGRNGNGGSGTTLNHPPGPKPLGLWLAPPGHCNQGIRFSCAKSLHAFTMYLSSSRTDCLSSSFMSLYLSCQISPWMINDM